MVVMTVVMGTLVEIHISVHLVVVQLQLVKT